MKDEMKGYLGERLDRMVERHVSGTDIDYASAGNTWHRDNYYRTWFPVEYSPAE